MSFRRTWTLLGLVIVSSCLATTARAQQTDDEIMRTAVVVLDEVMSIPARRIPESLLSEASGVAIIPNVVKGGFVVGVRHGRGVMLVRDEQGAWRAPMFVTLTGGSIGWQAGIQSTDLILVFRTQRSVSGLMNNKLTIGVDAAAAAGPVGRKASAATDATLSAEILSYSRSRGLFAGVSIDGSSMQVDHAATAAFYQPRPIVPGEPATAANQLPASAVQLLNRIVQFTTAPQVAAPELGQQPQGLPGPAQPVLVPQQNLATQLAASQNQLQPLLDGSWRTFLLIPTDATGQLSRDPAQLREVLQRYDSVATDARYANLATRPEFVATHQRLRQYVATLAAATDGRLSLPPPPGTSPAAGPGF